MSALTDVVRARGKAPIAEPTKSNEVKLLQHVKAASQLSPIVGAVVRYANDRWDSEAGLLRRIEKSRRVQAYIAEEKAKRAAIKAARVVKANERFQQRCERAMAKSAERQV